MQTKIICGFLIFFASLLTPTSAMTQDVSNDMRIVAKARLKYEFVKQDDRSQDAHSLTQRLGLVIEKDLSSRITTLFEGEAIFAVVDKFDDGRGELPSRPVVADPDSLELNRAQVKLEISDQTFLTAGRQKLSIDDERFIGPASFRQNDQTFDGIHFSAMSKDSTTFQVGYFNRVNRVLGAKNPAGRFKGNSYFINANVDTPIGRLGAFHYALDLGLADELSLTNQSSSRTSGIRYDGRWHQDTYGLDVEASWARQTDFADNPINYKADYLMGSLRVFTGSIRASARIENLGSDTDAAFQTPLGTLHKFQGLADVFLVTPSGGLRDVQIKGDWLLGDVGPVQNIVLSSAYHHFSSGQQNSKLGSEIDLSIKAGIGSFGVSATFANYRANTFAADTQRIFLSAATQF